MTAGDDVAADYLASDGVGVRRHPGPAVIAEIVLERPAAMNALSTAMARTLALVCAEIGADRGVRAVVLAAAGDRAFCVGAETRPGPGALCTPATAVPARTRMNPVTPPAALQRRVPVLPVPQPIPDVFLARHQQEFTGVHPPGLPPARDP